MSKMISGYKSPSRHVNEARLQLRSREGHLKHRRLRLWVRSPVTGVVPIHRLGRGVVRINASDSPTRGQLTAKPRVKQVFVPLGAGFL